MARFGHGAPFYSRRKLNARRHPLNPLRYLNNSSSSSSNVSSRMARRRYTTAARTTTAYGCHQHMTSSSERRRCTHSPRDVSLIGGPSNSSWPLMPPPLPVKTPTGKNIIAEGQRPVCIENELVRQLSRSVGRWRTGVVRSYRQRVFVMIGRFGPRGTNAAGPVTTTTAPAQPSIWTRRPPPESRASARRRRH
jgi:hypothetical protein